VRVRPSKFFEKAIMLPPSWFMVLGVHFLAFRV
jgi:hypothetical protein